MVACLTSRPLSAQQDAAGAAVRPASDVRQIVTFRFQPGRGDSAMAIYGKVLVPLYRADRDLLRFRGYREAESPVPLDLVIVSSFDGMAGMDASNSALRALSSGGRSVFQWYGELSAISQEHHDQFVEMLPALGDGDAAASDSGATLVVMEYLRITPGDHRTYERLVGARVRAVERARPVAKWSETGRLLVSDGWDYVRFIGIESLAAWQAYRQAMERSGASDAVDRLVAARRTIIVRRVPGLSVR